MRMSASSVCCLHLRPTALVIMVHCGVKNISNAFAYNNKFWVCHYL